MTFLQSSTISRKACCVLQKRFLSGFFLFVFLLSTTGIFAKDVTPEAALSIAKRYVTVDKQTQKSVRTRASIAVSTPPYYIYNDARGKGFVIVSGNDAMGEVLAYSHEGTLDTLRLNPEARFLLGHYSQVYEAIKCNPDLTTRARQAQTGTDKVDPLLKSNWGQRSPYNKFTDYPTGCVATAMSQIMYYHKWPLRGKGQNKYTLFYDKKERFADFSQSQYDWDHMQPVYNHGSYNTTEADAVAKLMSDIGIAVNMRYSPYSSGAQNPMAANAFRTYFDYDVAPITKDDEGTAQFTEIIKDELRKGFPLYISGNSSRGSSGHAWVADGFDRDGLIHMNFGWDGQANGYYSLSSLNLASSGDEFNRRPLSFSKQLIIIVVHPNKEGTEKIDEQLREDAPNIAFNLEGELHFVGTPPSTLANDVQIAYKYFLNQSSKPFVGDIGIGIYSEEGMLVRPCPSDDHATGGYTRSHFANTEGKMSRGGLIDNDVTFKVDLSGLSDGTYTLLPIAATAKETGWGPWMKIKKAPRIVMEVKNGQITYRELPSKTAAFQLMSAPRFDKTLQTGEEYYAHLDIRKLNGLPFNGNVKLELLKNDGSVAVSSETKGIVDFEMFAATQVKLPLILPDGMDAGRYELRLTVIKPNTQEQCIVTPINRQSAYFVDVAKGEKTSELLSNVVGYVQDNSSTNMPNEEIDVRKTVLFKVGCTVYRHERKDYKGHVKLYLIDTEDGRRFDLKTFPATIELSADKASVDIVSGWLRAENLKIINKRRYKLGLMGEVEGKEIDLWPTTATAAYVSIINGRYETYPSDVTNSIESDPAAGSLSFVNGRLEVQQEGLLRVTVYGINGTHIGSWVQQGQDRVTTTLPKAIYVVKITTRTGNYTKVVQ